MTCRDTFADANRARLAYIRELTFCEFPQPAEMQIARITSSDFAATKETSASDEIRSDRQVSDLAELSFTSGGSLAFEKSLTTFDDLLEGALCNGWIVLPPINAEFTITIDLPEAGQVTVLDILAAGLFAGILPGETYFISNGIFADWFVVVAVISSDEIVISDPQGLFVDGLDVNLYMTGDTLINGVEKISYSIEQAFLDVGFYQLFHGQRVGTWSLSVEAQSKITGSFAFQGTMMETATVEWGTTYLPPTDTPIINSTSNVGQITVDGAILETCIQSVSIELDNALREQSGVGSKYPCGIGLGRQQITGNLTAYFVDGTLYNAFLDHANAALSIPLEDNAGNYLLIDMPRVKFSSDAPAPSGIDTDIMDELDYQALFDAEAGYTIKLTRASIPALITTTAGVEGAPAKVALYGNFSTGTTLDCLIKSTANPAGNYAPLTLAADATAEEVAVLWADLIKGITEVTAVAVGSVVHISPFPPGLAVDVSELTTGV